MNQILFKNKHLFLHLMVFLLGFTGILGKLITIGSMDLVWYRMFFAFVSLIIFSVVSRRFIKIDLKDSVGLIGVGVIVALHWFFFFESIKVSNVSIAVISLSFSSVFSSILEPWILKRRIYAHEVILGGLIIIAFVLIFYTSNSFHLLGYAYGIISALLATLFTILNAKYLKKVDAVNITMYEMLGGVIFLMLYFIITNDLNILYFNILFEDLVYLIILSIICTSLIFVLMIELMKKISPFSLIIAVNLEPIYSILLALLIFQDSSEIMNIWFYIGSSLILLSIYLDYYFKREKSS